MPRKRRRAYGEGSVYQRADGRWVGAVELGRDAAGKRKRKEYTGASEAEAARKLRKALEQRDEAGLPQGKTSTLAAWLRHWLDTVAARKVTPLTLRSYRMYVEQHIIPALGHMPLDGARRLEPEQIELLYARLARPWKHGCGGKCPPDRDAARCPRAKGGPGLAPASILQTHRILARALKVAVQRGHASRNPALLVEPPGVPKRRPRAMRRADAQAVLRAVKDRRNAARWSVALAIGLRQGEALGLMWDDVDLDSGHVRAGAHQVQRHPWQHGCKDPARCGRKLPPNMRARRCPKAHSGGLVIVDYAKDGGSGEPVALPAELVAELTAHRAAQNKERLKAGTVWKDHGLVFAREDGRPIDPRDDWDEWKAILADAGVPDARLHDARHTAATLLLEQGVDVRVVQSILRHSSITVTEGYTATAGPLTQDAATRMGAALWGEAK